MFAKKRNIITLRFLLVLVCALVAACASGGTVELTRSNSPNVLPEAPVLRQRTTEEKKPAARYTRPSSFEIAPSSLSPPPSRRMQAIRAVLRARGGSRLMRRASASSSTTATAQVKKQRKLFVSRTPSMRKHTAGGSDSFIAIINPN